MKKSVVYLLSLSLMLIIISGCNSGLNNEIGLANLTADQQEIINLLTTSRQEVFIFSYQTDNAFESVDFWIEIYSYGELMENLGGLSFSTRNPLNGRLSVTISNDAVGEYRWTFGVSGDGFRADNIVDFSFLTENIGSMARGHGPTRESIPIQDGRAIILHSTKFYLGNVVYIDGSRNSQDYIDHPELLAEYPYVIFIKARFSNTAW